MFVRAPRAAVGEAIATLMACAARRGRGATSTGRCRATRISSAPSRSTSATICSPTSGCSRATASASPFVERAGRGPAARRRRAGGVNFDTDRAHGRRGARLRRRRAELDRRRLQPRLRARLPVRGRHVRDAPLAARRRARAVVERGVRLRRALGRLDDRLLIMPQKKNPDAAELLRARRRASSPSSRRCTACSTRFR